VHRLLVGIVLALTLVPSAFAGGSNPAGFQGGVGATLPGGDVRYVALDAMGNTSLAKVDRRSGALRNTLGLIGSWGIPRVGTDSINASLSRDGRTLVLAPTEVRSPSTFAVVDTKAMRVEQNVMLAGTFAFDALSPNGTKLYLVQYVGDQGRYYVRLYDLAKGKLMPGRIADRTQKSWLMAGFASTRTSSSDGRFVYTLYVNPGGFPFVHALDTVSGKARCTGIPWHGDADAPWNMRLALRDGGHRLAVNWADGGRFVSMDTTTWKVSSVQQPGGFPWLWAGLGAGAAAVLLAAALLVYRRRRPGALRVAVRPAG
jgi:hypothetical protein